MGRIKAESIRQHGTVLRELDKSGNETIYGNLTVTGDLDVAGVLAGLGLDLDVTEITSGGAATISGKTGLVVLNKTTPKIEAVIAAPTPGQVLIITQVDGGTAGHTVTLSAGTWDGTNDVATLNAAGETLVVVGVSATRFLVLVNLGSVGFS